MGFGPTLTVSFFLLCFHFFLNALAFWSIPFDFHPFLKALAALCPSLAVYFSEYEVHGADDGDGVGEEMATADLIKTS